MRTDGINTREKILDNATSLIFEYGYGGTTVDEIITKAGITKGAFFYHFKTKEDLARALVGRYATADRTILDTAIKTAETKTSNPVEQLLAIVDYYIELLKVDPHADGCLYASYCYESGLLEAETLKPVQDAILYWRDKMTPKMNAAIAAHPPRVSVDAVALADYFLATFEGGFILARTLKEPFIIVKQLSQFRSYLAALFS